MSAPRDANDANNEQNPVSFLWLNDKSSPAWFEWPRGHAIPRYLAAVLALSMAFAGRLLLQPVFHDDAPFATFYFAVIVIGYLAGSGPAVLVAAAGAIAGVWFMMPAPNLLWCGFYCLVSATMIWTMQRRRQERDRAEVALRLLREAHDRQSATLASLDRSEQRLRFGLEIGAVGTCIFDTAAKTITCDERCRAILGLPEVSNDKAWWDLIDPEYRARITEAFTAAVRSAIPQTDAIESRITRQDGQVRWISLRVAGTSGERARLLGSTQVFGFVQDISDRRHSDEQIARMRSLESVGLLASGVAHKFNNLLTTILVSANVLDNRVADECRVMISAITEACLQAAKLTEQLLAYAGKSYSFIDAVDLSGAVRDATALLRPSISQRVTLHDSLGPNLIVQADRGQIEQVVTALVMNAAEAIPQNQSGDILIRTGTQEIAVSGGAIDEISQTPVPPGSYVCLEVRDTGSGMTPQIQRKIFEPFFTTRFAGRGLGLPALAGILRVQRGFIQVISAPGQGSTFRVLLPAANGSGVAAAEERSESAAAVALNT
jgi:PAS domain S-box-containing protein